jgi:hypothetical protein
LVKTFGEVVGSGDACDAGIVLNSMSMQICTRVCATSADCGGSLPNCGAAMLTNPSGNGSSPVNACTN